MKVFSYLSMLRFFAIATATFLGATALGAFSGSAHATTSLPLDATECHHDAAPVDTGRFTTDLKNKNVVATKIMPAGKVIRMTYLLKDGSIKRIVCKTTIVRTIVLANNGDQYDSLCGNIVEGFDVETPAASTPAQAVSKVVTPPIQQQCPTCAKASVTNFTATSSGKCQAVIYNGIKGHVVVFGRVRRAAPDSRYLLTVSSVDGTERPKEKQAIILGQVPGSYAYVDGGDACHSTVARAVTSNWPDVLVSAGLPSSCTPPRQGS